MFVPIAILLLCSNEIVANNPIALNVLYKVPLNRESELKVSNGKQTIVLVEIFSPSLFLDVSYTKGRFINVLQASILIPASQNEYIKIQANVYNTYFWYRVIDTMNIMPRDCSTCHSFQMKITEKNNWYTLIEFPRAYVFRELMVPRIYNLWVFPIFPNGQLGSWQNDYSGIQENLIISSINSSFGSSVLKNKGFLIGRIKDSLTSRPLMQFTIPNRKTYTNLIIIEAVFSDSFSMQYPPIIIYGCEFENVLSSMDTGTSRWSKKQSCRVVNDGTWLIIIISIAGSILFLILIGFAFENLLSLIFTWLLLSYVFCIGFHYIFWDVNGVGTNLYYILCGICPAIALLLSIFYCCVCPTKSRLRIIFNILCIIVIVYHLLWFIFQTFVSDYKLLLGIISTVSIIMIFLLTYFYEFTITFGSVFVSIYVALCGISLFAINSSSFPYLFLDFFNYILYRDSNVYYYTYFLLDDLVLFVSLVLSVVLMGCLSYNIYKRRNKEDKPNSVKPSFNHQSLSHESDHLDSRLDTPDIPPPPYTPRATNIELASLPPYS